MAKLSEKTFNRVTKSAYRPPVALVRGTVRGVPFSNYFKTLRAAHRVHAKYFGSELVLL